MASLYLKQDYKPRLSVMETEVAVKQIKDFFQGALSKALHLTRVSAPLFVFPETGLNDDLSGSERPVSFGIREQGDRECQIVHSLAKWKRSALGRYGFSHGKGLYTDMNAIRRDEDTDNTHSIYVDQWDWERVIDREERNLSFLKQIVEQIYGVFLQTQTYVNGLYSMFSEKLPKELVFISSQELLDKYPGHTPKERENLLLKEVGAAFITQIGGPLSDGKPHDLRAPDYDDWSLNGDLMLYNPVLEAAYEVSSMGIRVDEHSLKTQLAAAGCEERKTLAFHNDVLNGRLPYTIGGGIGQSRICMFFLEKLHIGEVQASVWKEEDVKKLRALGVELL